ncbi:beta-ketoacyl-ACP synthase III [Flavobacterium sp. NRK1]|uniref:beta-ketoacyl-ACP synthase III n=1 Tax=Flavobacterium sp. NRK1 TaxID=2954929 RepID=UPI00209295CC|nr:beta-ketoacyl-ACP synthase III [Flavobacterium sp. NRK1]MCO6148202.1 ketoacyl-ACP synthase III [Flavobacterium sp. NRK1]
MNTRINAAITAVGGYVPDTVLNNAKLEKMVDTSDEWITSRTGIKERRILEAGKATSDMAAMAIKNLLNNTGVNPDEIEVLIIATSTPDHQLAPTAPLAAQKAGLKNAWGFDFNAACSGFLYALSVAASLLESGRHKKVLLVGADKMSAIVNYEDRNTCVLFGDGAGAVLLEPSKDAGAVLDTVYRSDGNGVQFLSIPAGGSAEGTTEQTLLEKRHYVEQDGRTVFKNAINGMTATSMEVLEKCNFTTEDIDWVVPHQANLRIIDVVGEKLGIAKEKIKVNIQRYGNTTAATLPLCLWDFQNDFKPGDKLLLTAFGAGFTWGSTCIIWGGLRNNNKK